ncbi:MAG: hypothetical protein AMS26_02490, partial [Bacteroides sp. SM23_62]
MLKRRKQVPSDEPTLQKPLKLWPGVIIVMLQWLIRFGIPVIIPGASTIVFGVLGGLLGGLAIIMWWAFFSQAPRTERWGAVILMIVALIVTPRLIHKSIETGFQGMMFFVYAIPVLSLAFVIWAVASRRLSAVIRRATMVVTIMLACGVWILLRSDGITGDAGAVFAWRWAKTPEELFLAQSGNEPTVVQSVPEASETEAVWPGFRGPHRDGIIFGVQIRTDWSLSPPVELWRRPIGPGCSSFAVHGDFFYTQEQIGDDEVIACYNVTTGKLVWRHSDSARFWDSHAGVGPRATPTLSGGHVYTLGATGILNVLDARDGALVWSRNAWFDTGVELPGWGFTSSPLVVDDIVIVATAGTLAAYECSTGDPRWFGPDGGAGYSSPHLLTIDGVPQILLMSEIGATSVAPTDGRLLWQHEWPEERIVQPAITPDGDLLLSAGGVKGMRRISVDKEPGGWKIKEHWTSVRMKPNFNDFVIHKGHAFGFDGPSLVCIDIEDGERKWRGGRYGGQLLLLADQDLLLVLSEKGELALVCTAPDQFTELTRFPAIEGKT